VFHVASSLTTVTVTVRSLAPFPQRVEVLVERTPVAVLNLTEHDWVPTRLVLPKTRGRYHRLELRVSPTWQAPRDGRELGVMLAWEGR
jgi:hypothetical protein